MTILRVEIVDNIVYYTLPPTKTKYIVGYPAYVSTKLSQYLLGMSPNVRIIIDAYVNWDEASCGGLGYTAQRLLEVSPDVYDIDPALLDAAKETVRKALRRERARIDKDLEKLS